LQSIFAASILTLSVENESQRLHTIPPSLMTTIDFPTFELELIPLTDLKDREEAVVHVADLEPSEREALAAMGLQKDCVLHLCQQGQPCIVQVEATRLGLSREVTERILVRRCNVCNEA
jgi:Fe2+ transport system protein FeoA